MAQKGLPKIPNQNKKGGQPSGLLLGKEKRGRKNLTKTKEGEGLTRRAGSPKTGVGDRCA